MDDLYCLLAGFVPAGHDQATVGQMLDEGSMARRQFLSFSHPAGVFGAFARLDQLHE